jgi:hypothetical protein
LPISAGIFPHVVESRAALDALLAKRLPDVEVLTTGGAGVPMLAASYAASRGLNVVAMVPGFGRWPDAVAVAKRDAELVALAEAAVIVWGDGAPPVRGFLDALKVKGVPVHVVGREAPRVRPVARAEAERRGLPD